jgi:hypothetical protein
MVASARIDEDHCNNVVATTDDIIQQGVVTFGTPMDNSDDSNNKEETDVVQSILITTSTEVDQSEVVLLPVFFLPTTDNTTEPQLVIMKVALRGSTLSPRDLKAAIMPHIPASELKEGLLTWFGKIDLNLRMKDLNVHKVVVENDGQTTNVTFLEDNENLMHSSYSSSLSLGGGGGSSTVVYCIESDISKRMHSNERSRWKQSALHSASCVFFLFTKEHTIAEFALLLCVALSFSIVMAILMHLAGRVFEYFVGDEVMMMISRRNREMLEPEVSLKIKNYYLRHSAIFRESIAV